MTSKTAFAKLKANYENNDKKRGFIMADAVWAFFELMGVVSICGFIAAGLAAVVMAIDGLGTTTKQPMIMRGEYRCYINRQRIR